MHPEYHALSHRSSSQDSAHRYVLVSLSKDHTQGLNQDKFKAISLQV